MIFIEFPGPKLRSSKTILPGFHISFCWGNSSSRRDSSMVSGAITSSRTSLRDEIASFRYTSVGGGGGGGGGSFWELMKYVFDVSHLLSMSSRSELFVGTMEKVTQKKQHLWNSLRER